MDPKVRDALRAMFGGRPVVLTGGPVAGLARLVPSVTELSGHRPFILATGIGTGALPDPADADVHVLSIPVQSSLVREVHHEMAVLAELPAAARAAVDAWDPDGRAVALASPFYTGRQIAGRPVLGGRRPEWAALEDKTTADELWDRAGVARVPSRVVPATYDALTAAATELATGAGTVWSGDARDGFNGGGEHVRWVRDDDQARAAIAFFRERADRVRVMPFLDGVPCAIHGVVFPDGVAALRPVEMITLRRVGASTDVFVYGGMSTYWDPPDADRDVMRDVARRVATVLRDEAGYLGGLSVDGVLTRDGFRPTELNPRFSGGLGAIAKGLPDFPLQLVLAGLVCGYDVGLGAADFEELLLASADADRWGGGSLILGSVSMTATDERPVVLDADTVRLARDDEPRDGVLMLGPSAMGSYLRFEPDAGQVPHGCSLAPTVVAAFSLADEIWGTRIGELAPARDVRAGNAAVGPPH